MPIFWRWGALVPLLFLDLLLDREDQGSSIISHARRQNEFSSRGQTKSSVIDDEQSAFACSFDEQLNLKESFA